MYKKYFLCKLIPAPMRNTYFLYIKSTEMYFPNTSFGENVYIITIFQNIQRKI